MGPPFLNVMPRNQRGEVFLVNQGPLVQGLVSYALRYRFTSFALWSWHVLTYVDIRNG